jgi:hypothetical protein
MKTHCDFCNDHFDYISDCAEHMVKVHPREAIDMLTYLMVQTQLITLGGQQ